MTAIAPRDTAQIIHFPRDVRRVLRPVPAVLPEVSASGWYHDEAIREAVPPKPVPLAPLRRGS